MNFLSRRQHVPAVQECLCVDEHSQCPYRSHKSRERILGPWRKSRLTNVFSQHYPPPTKASRIELCALSNTWFTSRK